MKSKSDKIMIVNLLISIVLYFIIFPLIVAKFKLNAIIIGITMLIQNIILWPIIMYLEKCNNKKE